MGADIGKSAKESGKAEDGLKPKKKYRVKAISILKKTVFLGTAATVCVLLALILISVVGLFMLYMDLQRLEGEAKLIDEQLAVKEAQLRSKQKELDGKGALLKAKDRELISTLGALNLTRQRETSLDGQSIQLQRENKDLSQKLNATSWERDQYAVQAGNYSTENLHWEQKYDSLLSQYGQEQKKREAETLMCENLVVEISPDTPRVSDDFTLRFSYGNGSPASGLPVYIRSMYEFKGGESERPRFHLTDKEGKVFVRGESASFGGSGETTVVLTCEKNIYYMRFYLYTNTQETWQQQYGLEKVGYSNYA